MSIKRFKFLVCCLRFDNCDSRTKRKNKEQLAAVQEIFSKLVTNCQMNYSLGKNVTIDKMLIGFCERCIFCQHIPSKSNKYGIKIFALVNAETYYLYILEVYAGKQPERPHTDVVKRMCKPLYKSGWNVTANNWFTDLNLLKELKEKALTYVGTIKKKRELSANFISTQGKEQYSSTFGFSKDSTLVSYIPKKGCHSCF